MVLLTLMRRKGLRLYTNSLIFSRMLRTSVRQEAALVLEVDGRLARSNSRGQGQGEKRGSKEPQMEFCFHGVLRELKPIGPSHSCGPERITYLLVT